MVGEQPGDVEDQQGLPFVGPAGRLLRDAVDDAGIDPAYALHHQRGQALPLRAARQAAHPPDARTGAHHRLPAVAGRRVRAAAARSSWWCSARPRPRRCSGPSFRVTQSRGQLLPWPASAQHPRGLPGRRDPGAGHHPPVGGAARRRPGRGVRRAGRRPQGRAGRRVGLSGPPRRLVASRCSRRLSLLSSRLVALHRARRAHRLRSSSNPSRMRSSPNWNERSGSLIALYSSPATWPDPAGDRVGAGRHHPFQDRGVDRPPLGVRDAGSARRPGGPPTDARAALGREAASSVTTWSISRSVKPAPSIAASCHSYVRRAVRADPRPAAPRPAAATGAGGTRPTTCRATAVIRSRRSPWCGEEPQLAGHLVDHQADQLGAARDVGVDRHQLEPEPVGDLAHGERRQPFLVGHRDRRPDHLVDADPLLRPAGSLRRPERPPPQQAERAVDVLTFHVRRLPRGVYGVPRSNFRKAYGVRSTRWNRPHPDG